MLSDFMVDSPGIPPMGRAKMRTKNLAHLYTTARLSPNHVAAVFTWQQCTDVPTISLQLPENSSEDLNEAVML